jgi:hypothetical protein
MDKSKQGKEGRMGLGKMMALTVSMGGSQVCGRSYSLASRDGARVISRGSGDGSAQRARNDGVQKSGFCICPVP